MKIIDGLKLKGRPAEIPDCSRDDLPQFFIDMDYKVGAEIGVFKGDFSEKLCKAGLKLYAIDPWSVYSDYPDRRGERRLSLQYEETKKLLALYDCTVIRKTSMDALADIPNESLDFVYIDGNHNFKYIAQDLCEWPKKIRRGGVISGHDYFYSRAMGCKKAAHVAYVLNAYVEAFGIKNWYVLGRKHIEQEQEKRDKWRSWMWVKE